MPSAYPRSASMPGSDACGLTTRGGQLAVGGQIRMAASGQIRLSADRGSNHRDSPSDVECSHSIAQVATGRLIAVTGRPHATVCAGRGKSP